MSESIKQKVYASMQNAVDNGYTFMGMTDEDVAADLLDYSSDLEDHTVGDIVRYVKQFCWQKEIDRITACLEEGNFVQAESHLNTWIPSMKAYLESFLPTDKLIELNHYRQTK